jgi:hypothetical protein
MKSSASFTRRASPAPVLAALALASTLAAAAPSCPIASIGGPYFGYHNQPIQLDASASFDLQGWGLSYSWDTNGDGTFGDALRAIAPVTYASPGTVNIAVSVTNLPPPSANVPECTVTAYSVVEIGNHKPVAASGGPYQFSPGRGLVLDASSSYDPDSDQLTYSWDLNADGNFDDLSGITPSLSAADSLARFGSTPGSFYSIAVKVTDAFGASDIRYTALNVAAVPEPTTMALFLAGLLAVAARKAHRKEPTGQRL